MNKYLLTGITFFIIINCSIIQSQSESIDKNLLNEQENKDIFFYKIYFVIGIGIYFPYQGTWPVINEILPVLLLKIGLFHCKLLHLYNVECIDFIDGDKFFGYYPFLRTTLLDLPVAIGPVCGIWLDKQ